MSIIIDGFTFPPSALAYLRRHKGDGDLSELCGRQLHRARKQVDDLVLLNDWRPRSILDIGCGLAMVPVILAQRSGIKTIHLMDGDGTGEKFADYREIGQPWNDVQTGVDLVRANVPWGVEVIGHQADPAVTIPVDLIVSFKSWGLHYPVETYMGLAARSLREPDVLVIDLHREGEACATLEAAGYRLIHKIGEYGEEARTIIPFTRHVFQKLEAGEGK